VSEEAHIGRMSPDSSTLIVFVAGLTLAYYWDYMAHVMAIEENFLLVLVVVSAIIASISLFLQNDFIIGLLQRVDNVNIINRLWGKKKTKQKSNSNISPFKPYNEVRRLLEDMSVYAKVEVVINGKTGHYEGMWNNGVKKGRGTLMINGKTYAGEWDNNRVTAADGLCYDLDSSIVCSVVNTAVSTTPYTQYPGINATPITYTNDTTSETPNDGGGVDPKRNLNNDAQFAEEGLTIRVVLYITKTNSYDERVQAVQNIPRKLYVETLKEKLINEVQKLEQYVGKKFTFYVKSKELMGGLTVELQQNDVVLVVVDEPAGVGVATGGNNGEYESRRQKYYDCWQRNTNNFTRLNNGRLVYRDLHERLEIDPNDEHYKMTVYEEKVDKIRDKCLHQIADCDMEYNQGQQRKRYELMHELTRLHDKLNQVSRPSLNTHNYSLMLFALDSEDEYEERYNDLKSNEFYAQITDKTYEQKDRKIGQRLAEIQQLRELRGAMENKWMQDLSNRESPNYKDSLVNNKQEVLLMRDQYMSLASNKEETLRYISHLEDVINRIDAALEEYTAMANKLPGMKHWEEWENTQNFNEFKDKNICMQILEGIPQVFSVSSITEDAKLVDGVKKVVRKLMELRDYVSLYKELGDQGPHDVYTRALKWFVLNVVKKVLVQLESSDCSDMQLKVCYLLIHNIMVDNTDVEVKKLVKGCVEEKRDNEKIVGLFALLCTTAYTSSVEELYNVKDGYRWLKAVLDAAYKPEVTDTAVHKFLLFAGKSLRQQWPDDALYQEVKEKFASSDAVQDVLARLQRDTPAFPAFTFDGIKPYQWNLLMYQRTRGVGTNELENFEADYDGDNSRILNKNTLKQTFSQRDFVDAKQAVRMRDNYVRELNFCRRNTASYIQRVVYLRCKVAAVIIESLTEDGKPVSELKYANFIREVGRDTDKAFRAQFKAMMLSACPSLCGDFTNSIVAAEYRIACKETRLIELYTTMIVHGLEKNDPLSMSFTVDDGWQTLAHVVNMLSTKPQDALIKRIIAFLYCFMGPASDRSWIILCANKYRKYKPNFKRVISLLITEMAKGGNSKLRENNESKKTESFLRLETLLDHLQKSLR